MKKQNTIRELNQSRRPEARSQKLFVTDYRLPITDYRLPAGRQDY
jgi:hypothetical protein